MNLITTLSTIFIFSFLFVAIMVTPVTNASTNIEIDAITTLPNITPPDIYLEPIAYPEPTMADIDVLKIYLVSDKTDSNPYIASGTDNYVCSQFGIDLANNLSESGISSGVVVRSAKYHNIGSGHIMTWAIVNGSLFVVEPQTDQVFNPDTFNNSIDREIYVLRYESIESGIRKASEEYKRRI